MIDICILGASGSIGTQTIDVMNRNRQDFNLVGFSIGSNTRKIRSILIKYPNVKYICLKELTKAKIYQKKYPNITFFSGDEGLIDLIKSSNPYMVVNALVGFVGLKPTIESLKLNKVVALANKESLVVGGELINNLLSKGQGKIFPIDSEHAALAKCLAVDSNNVDKLIITASGGAFRDLSREQLNKVTPELALAHPTWKMGKKITIDCATMVNKTFEIIEAHYLFNYDINGISILICRNSYCHSLVKYLDNTYRLDVGKPDMRIPIKYALYEGMCEYKTVFATDISNIPNVKFEEFNVSRYPIVRYAKKVIEEKGTFGAVFNASNEEAVKLFLENKIDFIEIENIIAKCMDNHKNIKHPSYEDLLNVDLKTRELVNQMINKEEN